MPVTNLKQELTDLKNTALYRELVSITPVGPTRGYLKGREVTLFCTNNYLGLTHHPQVIEASIKATGRFGTGAGASRLISGHSHLYEELEDALARHKGTEKALVFSSGYAANMGVISALMGRDDLIFCDRLAHASLIDACILSRARPCRFRHNDVNSLKDLLHTQETKGQRLIITEGVFSMDGDIAPLGQLADISSQHGCLLLVDDAHGTGVMGGKGQGTAAYLGVSRGIDIHVGTLSKAIGSVGGFVAGSSDLIAYLVNKARSFIYTTALPPGSIAAATAAIKLIEAEPSLIERLWFNVRYMRDILISAGFNLMGSQTPIMPIFIGAPEKAVAMSRGLLKKGGIYVPAIRPPTVPAGQARLRLTVSAAHQQAELENAAGSLIELGRKEGIID
ncbi:MAG TPA: 8-amino-7-oxononanoate synthase [Proteobacteria bacterium]|nr:8-amino-7-oxononanoate synthase [Pseudomonadota bacterium]